MPEVSRFYGLVIRMYVNDHGRPHFHVIYSEDTASLDIETREIVEGALPARAYRLAREWGEAHASELLDNWNRLRAGQTIVPVAPLE